MFTPKEEFYFHPPPPSQVVQSNFLFLCVQEAVVQMNEYVSLPAQRLAHLVRKYVHHCRMKEIEGKCDW